MGTYLEIADQALLEMEQDQESPAKPVKPSFRHCEESEESELSRLRLLAGPDWPEFEADPEQMATLRRYAAEAKLVRAGVVPDTYTATVTCRRCGEVPMPPTVPTDYGYVAGCYWCANRVAGLPMPRPNNERGQRE